MKKKLIQKQKPSPVIEEIKLLDKDTGNLTEHKSVSNLIPKTSTHDPNMICCEVYNHDNEEIHFHSMLDKSIIICKGDNFAFLPHQYYTAYKKSGRPCKITKNFGKNKFIGNKYQSTPE